MGARRKGSAEYEREAVAMLDAPGVTRDRKGTGKGSGVVFQEPLGRPRGRSVDSIPKRVAIRRTQPSSPNGLPRCTLVRTASSSDVVCGRLTHRVQSRG
jgi:hypothetical protein